PRRLLGPGQDFIGTTQHPVGSYRQRASVRTAIVTGRLPVPTRRGSSSSAVNRLQVTSGGPANDLLAARGDDSLAADEERAVDPVELQRLQAPQDVPD